jgi:hypothetical protein
MSTIALLPIYAALTVYALWVFYLAVMNLSRAKKAGKLSKTAAALGAPVLAAGYVLDFVVNVLVMTVLLWERPRELTVTARLKRHHKDSTGWRLALVLWFEPLLDPFDPDGDHI